MNAERIAELFDVACYAACAVVAYISLHAAWITPVSVIGWQSFTFLRQGEWPALSVLDAWRSVAGNDVSTWATSPSSWLGAHWLLATLPVSLFAAAALASVGLVARRWMKALA